MPSVEEDAGFRWWREPIFGALLFALILIFVADLLVPTVVLLPILSVPVAFASLYLGVRATAALAGLGVAFALVVSYTHEDSGRSDDWVALGVVAGVGLIAVWVASARSRLDVVGQQTREQLGESEERFRLMAENASDIVFHTVDGVLEWISPSLLTVTGWEPVDLLGGTTAQLWHPDDRGKAVALRDATYAGETGAGLFRFRCASGDYVWLDVVMQPFVEPSGHLGAVGVMRDVSARIVAEKALAESERKFRLMVENSMDLVFSLDMHATIEWVSPSSLRLVGYTPGELVGKSGSVLVEPADLPILLAAADQARAGQPVACRIRLVTKDRRDRWVEATPRALRDEAGNVIGGVIGVRDIQDEVLAREALAHEIAFDALTGLPGRALAVEWIQQVLDNDHDAGWALLCVGINGMTTINQAYTYAAGDVVLQTVAQRLTETLGAPDQLARIAGDEFVVIKRSLATATDAAITAQQLLDAIRKPVSIDGVDIEVTACVGIALSTGPDADHLMRDASAAMRQATALGANRWEFLDGDVSASTRRKLTLTRDLRRALGDIQIQAWYQPVVSLADGRIQGYEALARWVKSDGSVVPPDQFIPVAEQTGLVTALDQSILDQALTAVAKLPSELHMAVNLSAVSLRQADLVESVVEAIERAGVIPSRLQLEVTETSLLQLTKEVLAQMRKLADLGVLWWADDFGTGYSSITHLREMPLHGLKLDRSFSTGISPADRTRLRLNQGLVGLAEGLELATIAEGVETAAEAEILAEQGWQMAQGWRFGRPTPEPMLSPTPTPVVAATN